jgi:hypothetical protein
VSRVVGFAAPVERSAKPYPVAPAGISGCNCRRGPLGHWHRAHVLASAVALADSAPRQVRIVCSRTDALYGQHVMLSSRTDRASGASPAFGIDCFGSADHLRRVTEAAEGSTPGAPIRCVGAET